MIQKEDEDMKEDFYRIGLDVGSTTAKIAVLDQNDQLVYSRYERHNAHVTERVRTYFDDLKGKIGDSPLSICVTGSVGMSTADQLQAPFVQEVVAATVFAKSRYPQAKALIDIGGEDAKVVFFNGRNMELRMNGNCAGGTGAFLDQMSVLMGTDNQTMSDLAMKATHIYPMAARCGVFAKTDIQNLMSRDLPKTDIAASIFHSVAVQTVVTLSHGCTFNAPILLCGGPLSFLPALRKAFADYLKMDSQKDFIITRDAKLIPALGCAIRSGRTVADQEKYTTTTLAQLIHRMDTRAMPKWKSTLKPLFKDEREHQDWMNSKKQYAIPVKDLQPGKQQVVIGIDSGSTTTKVVAVKVPSSNDLARRKNPEIVFTDYRPNVGDPIKAAAEGLQALKEKAEAAGTDLEIMGSCSTGYGEELIKTAFNLDSSIIETMAHYRAAARMMPDVSFILDIGGQDMKAIFVEKGAVVRMELNESCSSGCGTFIQTFASSLGYSVQDFARLACTADAPCDLGTRCTVFMNSKVKQVLREGATIADISAGISYSVIKNCLYKVLKLHDNEKPEGRIVVQGGTMRNDAVVRAFELLTGTDVCRSNMPELMGAYGCALHALTNFQKRRNTKGHSIDELVGMSSYQTRQLRCHGCENQCYVSMYTFKGGNKFYSGNKCERIFNNHGKSVTKGENIYVYKYHALFDRPLEPIEKTKKAPSRKIGIPRILNMYEEYPFWNALLRNAGFTVVLSSPSTFFHYESALNTVMADNICFPAKLVHSHIAELEGDETIERILMPYVVYEHNEDKRTINSYNCPIVSGYSDVIRSAMEPKTPIDSPVINFSDERLLEKQIIDYLKTLGVSRARARKAFAAAVKAEEEYTTALTFKAKDILKRSQQAGHLTIVLAGRPYHADPLIQHKLSEMIASLGADVISDDIVRGNESINSGETYLVKQWAYMNRIIKSGQWTAEQGNHVHFVQMTSFGCGPDAFIQDEIRDILRRHGKPYTLLKIDDVSNIGSLKLRVRSLVESLRFHVEHHDNKPFVTTRVFKKPDVRRKILAPYFTEYLTPILRPALKLMGYDVEVLPMADQESADLGLKYANNEICYPATLIVGDIIKALKSGKYDLNNTAVAMSQTGGQCRATNYAGLIKRAMVANGFQNVPLVTLGVTAHEDGGEENEQEGFGIPWTKYANLIINSLLFGDAISEMYNATIVREDQPGVAMQLRKKYMGAVGKHIEDNDPKGIVKLLSKAARDFDRHAVCKETPKVGIVGEIFLKFNPFSHEFIEKHIISKGIEVVPPLLTPFFLQEFVNVEVRKHLRLTCSRTPDFVVNGIYQALIGKHIKAINKVASRFRYFRPFSNIYNDARQVKGVVSMAAQFGEGWLLPADIISYIRDGVKNVISLQPFGCIANQVVSKGIEKKLHRLYPDLNLVSLDFDSGVSTVNVINRLLLFIDSIAV
ncbi:MAG: acyl-CoA dehydratase activase-related protein [Prevotella sp.]|jgi:predicted CoA-substrate-specific enzyme activase|nr:acyl-CoA dehydratase activase-related protein [Prevotella sp.]MCH3992404.1 acyl-CoA dehydratase activase-related protein [Prevotella sp.]MCI1473016.1 acyl-CoA dehydratase activase-related protein [Prevotella sp.]